MSAPTRTEIAGLTCAQWSPAAGSTVLALHGLTSTSEVWRALAEALPGARIVAPDLPGRGGSVDVRVGPGLAGHAAAVVRLADELDLTDLVVIGHSMGAYVGPLVAAGLGARVRKVVLLDGGVAAEPGLLVRRPVVRAAFGLQARRLTRRWRDVEAFVGATEGKAIANRADLRPRMAEWAGYLLAGPAGQLRPRVDAARLVADAVDTLAGDATLPVLAAIAAPVHVMVARNGKDDNAGPLISDRAMATGKSQLPRMTSARLTANHLTMLFDPAVPAAILST
jgi:pimeloyl-ACP methyl ester carboxylesterase